LLADILPIAGGANSKTQPEHTLRVAEHAEAELGEERNCFIDGCPAEWAALPIPECRIVIGLDGGYVCDWKDRQTNFEVIVGQSVPEEREARYVGLVHTYDEKPKRRLFDVPPKPGSAGELGCHLPDRWWRGGPCADGTCHAGVRARSLLVPYHHASDRALPVRA
jgi:hypothetical protein